MLTVVFPQRFHIFLPRFRLPILDISSCDRGRAREGAEGAGDPAYPLRVNLQSPFRNAVLTAQREAYNEAMSSVRSSVEWLFGDIVNYFKFLDFKKNLKLGFELSRENVYC